MSKFIGHIRVDPIAFALHRVLDAVLDRQQSEQKQQKVVQRLLAVFFLIFSELDRR